MSKYSPSLATRIASAMCIVFLFSQSAWAETRRVAGVELTGEFKQGGLLRGKTEPGSQIRLNGKAVRVNQQGNFVLGFGRDDQTQQTLEVICKGASSATIHLATREYKIQRVDGVPARTVNPDPAHLKRIRQEAAEVKQARNTDSDIQGFLQHFIWPIQGPITGVYGSQRVYNGEPRRPHFGIDIAAPEGTEILAPADGTITLAHPDMFFSGATMVIDHGLGLSTSYLHMSKMLVSLGDTVKQGQVIGLVGATGRATGPHLCWRLNWYETRLDPQLLVPAMQ